MPEISNYSEFVKTRMRPLISKQQQQQKTKLKPQI